MKLERAIGIDRLPRRERQRDERGVAAAEIGAIKLRQIIDMRARIGERAAFDQPLLEADDPMNGLEPLRRLEDLPSAQVAETDLEDVEIERRIEIVAERPLAGEIVDPGDDAAFVIDVVVERHRHQRLVGAVADLVAGIEVEQRLVEDRIGRAGLRRGRERAGRGVAIRHVDAEAEVLLDLREEPAEKRGCGSGASAVITLTVLPSCERTSSRLVVRQKSTMSAIARRDAAVSRGEARPVSTKLKQRLGEERIVIGRAVADLHRLPHRLGDAAARAG